MSFLMSHKIARNTNALTNPTLVDESKQNLQESEHVVTAQPTAVSTSMPTPEPTSEPECQEEMVWIPRTGAKYHSSSSCSNIKNPSQVTLDEAIRRGYEPCKKCYR